MLASNWPNDCKIAKSSRQKEMNNDAVIQNCDKQKIRSGVPLTLRVCIRSKMCVVFEQYNTKQLPYILHTEVANCCHI